MAKNRVDGVYDQDPRTHPEAHRFDHLTYIDALNMRVQVMDSTALSLCMENKLPIIVFSVDDPAEIIRVVKGTPIGTIVGDESLLATRAATSREATS